LSNLEGRKLMNHRRSLAVAPDTTVKVLALAFVLTAFGLVSMFLHRPVQLRDFTELPWWSLALLFAIAEVSVITVRVCRQNYALSFGDVPLVMGLFLASPTALMLGRLTGTLAIFVFYRRETGIKAVFHAALVLAGTAIAEIAFLSLLAGADPLSWRGSLAALVAAALAGLAVALITSRRHTPAEGRIPGLRLDGPVLWAVAVAAVVGLGGLVPVMAFDEGEAAPLLSLIAASTLLGYRAFVTLTDRHARLERLYQLSDALAGAPGSADVVRSVLSQSADLLRAGYAEVMLSGMGSGAHLWSLRHGGVVDGPIEPGGHHLRMAIPTDRLFVIRGATPAEVEFLAARGVSEAIVVPLNIDDPIAGHLLVADRLGEERGFVGGDARLLETVANHATVALRNGRLIERLHFEARHDELTGLPNRLNFRGLLDEAAEATARGIPCSVMVLDFNGFKAINDSLGHPAGDELLRVLAGRFQEAIGPGAIVARLGGDEFAVLSNSANASAAEALAIRLLGAFDEPVSLAGTRLRVGGSLGIALGPEHGTTGADLLRKADVAMYVAKTTDAGWRLYSSDMTIQSPEGLTLASDLRDAIRADQIEIVVQPLVDLATGAVHSFEALARWHHPTLGEIPPEEFFAAAERSGQVQALSKRVLARALAASRVWMDAGYPVRVAVNLAPRWPSDATLPDQIGRALAFHQVPAHLITLEITESSAFAEPGLAGDVLSQLSEMGVHLSVDDFGTGYSSLTYLSRLPVDQMKIHQSFIQQMYNSSRDRAVVQSIIDLGRNLGLQVVAEGVTDPGTRRALQEMGCHLAQGYLFTAPISIDDVPTLVRRVGIVPSAPPSRLAAGPGEPAVTGDPAEAGPPIEAKYPSPGAPGSPGSPGNQRRAGVPVPAPTPAPRMRPRNRNRGLALPNEAPQLDTLA
jgi:diguanylate cyclase (GGDEF)-like protein